MSMLGISLRWLQAAIADKDTPDDRRAQFLEQARRMGAILIAGGAK